MSGIRGSTNIQYRYLCDNCHVQFYVNDMTFSSKYSELLSKMLASDKVTYPTVLAIQFDKVCNIRSMSLPVLLWGSKMLHVNSLL